MQRLFSPVPKSPPAHATFIVVTPGNNEDEDGGTRRHTRIYIWCPIKVLLSNHNSTPLLQVLNGARRSNTSDLLHCTETRFRSEFGCLRRFGILTMACQNKCQRWFESGISCAFQVCMSHSHSIRKFEKTEELFKFNIRHSLFTKLFYVFNLIYKAIL